MINRTKRGMHFAGQVNTRFGIAGGSGSALKLWLLACLLLFATASAFPANADIKRPDRMAPAEASPPSERAAYTCVGGEEDNAFCYCLNPDDCQIMKASGVCRAQIVCATNVCDCEQQVQSSTSGGAPQAGVNERVEPPTNDPLACDESDPSQKAECMPGLVQPTKLEIQSVTRTAMTLSWQDNSTTEFGVELHKVDLGQAAQNGSRKWNFVGEFQERIDSQVKGTGMRSAEETGLEPDTRYCFRLRAYHGFSRSRVSAFSDMVCARTNP